MIGVMKEHSNPFREILEESSRVVDSQNFPVTSSFLERVKFLDKNFTDSSGNLDVDRLALSIVSVIGALEERIKVLEERERKFYSN